MGSLFKNPSKPDPLDVNAVTRQANSQNTANAFTQAAFNRPNQTDVFGNQVTYSQTGTDAQGNPTFAVNQSLGQVGQDFSRGFQDLGQGYFDAVASRPDLDSNAAFDRAYQYASANMEPRLQRAEDAARNRLTNQGFDPNSEAYRNQMADVMLQGNEARNNLVTGLQGQMFNQGLQNRQQQMSEYQPGLAYGQQAISPRMISTPNVNVGNVDIAGLNNAAKQQEWQRYQSDVAQRNAMLGGLATIGGSILTAPMGGGRGSVGGMLAQRAFGS